MNRLLPPVVFVLVAAIGLSMTWAVYLAEQTAEKARLVSLADEAVYRVSARLGQHLSLLQATKALFQAAGSLDRAAFNTFVEGLDLKLSYSGVQGIGYAKLIRAGEEQGVVPVIRNNYGITREVWPETSTSSLRTPIILLEPEDDRNRVALGYDMFSETRRREAMRQAMQTGKPIATAPLQLVQEITSQKQAGFLVYLPYYPEKGHTHGDTGVGKDDKGLQKPEAINADTGEAGPEGILPDGFVYAPFRAGDLFRAALFSRGRLPVLVRCEDVTGPEPALLFASDGMSDKAGSFQVENTVQIAGRTWRFTVEPTPGMYDARDMWLVYGMVLVSLILALALAALARSQYRTFVSTKALAEETERNLQEKDLMLQEMKHRMKNSIARVMAIARQTASHSDSLEAFNESFSARLLAMSNAQDMLTRSSWARADLKSLLDTELDQVMGEDKTSSTLDGPKVDINERATQALGLVFHELATNALKYGQIADPGAELEVRWTFETPKSEKGMRAGHGREGHGRRAARQLVVTWIERRPKALEALPDSSRKGFGTRLIRANIEGELRGHIEREITLDRTIIVLTLPEDSLR